MSLIGTPITVETTSLLDIEGEDENVKEKSPTMVLCLEDVVGFGIRAQFVLYTFSYFLIGTIVYYIAESFTASPWTFEEVNLLEE